MKVAGLSAHPNLGNVASQKARGLPDSQPGAPSFDEFLKNPPILGRTEKRATEAMMAGMSKKPLWKPHDTKAGEMERITLDQLVALKKTLEDQNPNGPQFTNKEKNILNEILNSPIRS